MSNQGGRPANETSDRIIALRLWGHRRFDQLYDAICHPAFTGKMIIEIPAKDGRPGEPWIRLERYGIHDL